MIYIYIYIYIYNDNINNNLEYTNLCFISSKLILIIIHILALAVGTVYSVINRYIM